MDTKTTLTEIWKNDSKVRLLACGMAVDGMLLAIILAAVAVLL